MTLDIELMAQKAGFKVHRDAVTPWFSGSDEFSALLKFAYAVQQATMLEAATVCEEMAKRLGIGHYATMSDLYANSVASELAHVFRVRATTQL